MSKKWWLIVSLYAMLCSQYLCAQSTQKRELSIEELFNLAEENSKSIKSYKTGTQASQEALKAAKASRLPDINASLSGSYIGNGYLWNRHFENGQSITMPHWGNNFSLSAAQVIYAGGAITNSIALADIKKKMSELDLHKNRQDVRFMLVGQYLDLYKLKNQQEVMQQNIELTEKLIDNTKERSKEGTVLKNDITRYELQLESMRLQLRRLKDAYSILNHQIVTTLALPEETEIEPQKDVYNMTAHELSEPEWQAIAEGGNVNIKQADMAVELNKRLVNIERSEQLPKIMFMAEEHMDGPILVEVPVINSNFNYWFVGLGIKYNISSLFKNNKKIKQVSLQLQQSKEQSQLARDGINNAVQASYTEYMTSFADNRTQQKSVELATRNYNVVNDRYENGLALLTDMLDASNIKLNAELNLVNAKISIIYNYYKMKYTSSSL